MRCSHARRRAVKAPNVAGAPSVRLSVAGTSPPTGSVAATWISGATAVFQTVAPPMSATSAQWIALPTSAWVGV